MEPQLGILSAIEYLKSCIEGLIEQLETYSSRMLPPEKNDEFIKILNELQDRLSVLPNTVNRSYELIQMVIRSIHSSRSELRKSVDGLIKKTGLQLQKVTSTTEEATNKILDVAEHLDEEQTNIISLIDNLESRIKQGVGTDEIFTEIRAKIYQNQEAAFTIMDYLQFQDITAQQIAGAYSLLSDTEKTLVYVSDLLKSFDPERDGLDGAVSLVDERAFNADASFADKTIVQDAIDNLFASGNTDVVIPDANSATLQTKSSIPGTTLEKMSDSSIDALFAGRAASVKEEQDGASQDDIDALFKTKKEDKNASQDDIDALFDKPKS